jgi:hypothetical protein
MLLVLLLSDVCYGQHKDKTYTDHLGYIHIDTLFNNAYIPTVVERENQKPLVVRHIILTEEDYTYNGLYRPREEALKLYGSNAVILVKLKPEVELLDLDQLLKRYHILLKYKNLPVFIDKHQLYQPLKMVAVSSAVLSVEIVNDTESNQKLISIVTKD